MFKVKGEAGKEALNRWISGARRCRIAAFLALQRRIVKHRAAIDAALEHGLSQGLIDSNTKIRLLTRIAFGFRSADALIALAMLALRRPPPHTARPSLTEPRTPDFLVSRSCATARRRPCRSSSLRCGGSTWTTSHTATARADADESRKERSGISTGHPQAPWMCQ